MTKLIAIWVSASLLLAFYLARQGYGDAVLLGAFALAQSLIALFWAERSTSRNREASVKRV